MIYNNSFKIILLIIYIFINSLNLIKNIKYKIHLTPYIIIVIKIIIIFVLKTYIYKI